MIRTILKVGLLLVAGILVYNYFFGTPEEKAQSKEAFSKVKELGEGAWNLLKAEKEKYDEGKYDQALDKIGNLYESLKDKAKAIQDSELLDKVAELEDKRQDLENRLQQNSVQTYGSSENTEPQKEEENAIKEDWRNLIADTEALMEKFEEK